MSRRTGKFLWILPALFTVALCLPGLGAEAPAAAEAAASRSWLGELFTDPLVITILFLAGTTLIGAFLKGRARDACLKDFHESPVHIEMADGKVIWGTLRVGNSGIEMIYDRPVGTEPLVKHSYLMYKSEYGGIQGVVRCHDALNDQQRRRRSRALNRSYRPGLLWRTARKIHNAIKTIRDAVNEAFGLILGRVKGFKGADVVKQQEKYIVKTQQQVTTAVSGASYDVLLEALIGQRVVVEFQRSGARQELEGVFKEYTANYIELMDVTDAQPFEVRAGPGAADKDAARPEASSDPADRLAAAIEAVWTDGELAITNNGPFPVRLEAVVIGEGERRLDPPVTLRPKGSHTEPMPDEAPAVCTLRCRALRKTDMVLPRSLAVIRHRAEPELRQGKA